MKTKIKQIDGLETTLNYQTAVVVGSDIQVNGVGTLPIKFKLTSDLSGTITINTLPLKNGAGEAVTELTQGLHEVAYDTGFFTLKSSGGLGTFFGYGSDGTIPNLNTVTTAPNGGTVANLWDMNAGTTFTTGTLSSASDQVVFSIDFGKSQNLSGLGGYSRYPMLFYNISISTGTARNITLEHSDDGVLWTQMGSAQSVNTSNQATLEVGNTPGNFNKRYWRVLLKAGGSNCTLSVQGVTINYQQPSGDTQTTKVWRILEPSTLNGAAVVKQYTDFNLPAGYEITVQNPNQGLVIYSQNDIVVNGVIYMSQKAGLAPNGNAIPMLISKKAYKTAKTSSLLHFDNNITDDNGRVWTNNGGATFDATNKKFGTHAISFNGTSQWIDTPASDDFSFGSDDFTIDFWVRPTRAIGDAENLFGGINNALDNFSKSIRGQRDASGKFYFDIGSQSGTIAVTSASTLNVNTFYHIAVVRYNGFLYLFVNGTLEAVISCAVNIYPCSTKFSIGRTGEYTTAYFQGQIDEFRIIKGKAMYTANFTPPTSAYTYQATFIDEPKTLEKYFQLTNVLQVLRGGYGGNGGYGGGHSGSTGRQTSVGIGGAGRQNLGGFGGGGSGGSVGSGGATADGGSISNSEIGGGFVSLTVFNAAGNTVMSKGINGSGAVGQLYNIAATVTTGKAFGGGSGGTGGTNGTTPPANSSDSQYSGGFLMLISKNNITNSGTIRANGGVGSNGSASVGLGIGAGGGGGGGGAGGGVIALFYGNAYSNTGAVQVNGGAGGTGGAGSSGGEAGGSGTSGSVGTIHTQKI